MERQCPNCNNSELRGEFCNKCGTKLPEISHKNTEKNTEKKMKKSTLVWILSGAGVLLVSATVVIVLLFFAKGSNNSPVAKTEQEPSTSTAPSQSPTPKPSAEPSQEPLTPIQPEIMQVDTSEFPSIRFYIQVADENNKTIENLKPEDFEVWETDMSGQARSVKIEKLNKIAETENISINMVMDKSDSMWDYDKISQSRYAATTFLTQVVAPKKDFVELTLFDDYVSVSKNFTQDYAGITENLYYLEPGEATALYDAIYTALINTYERKGSKFVIVFTDGMNNEGSCTYEDVENLAKATSIPVFIIGIGEDCDHATMIRLAGSTGGDYFRASVDNLGEQLAGIYKKVYTNQRDLYIMQYKSEHSQDLNTYRTLKISAAGNSGYSGEIIKEFIPVANINASFSDKYKSKQFIFPHSNVTVLTHSDLLGLSLAELRIARNEIFARYGRQFKDPLLNKWFYSKQWYQNIPVKYSPENFDKFKSPLSKEEQDNAVLISEYERYIIDNERIFPNGNSGYLTEYDVSLTKPILQKGLNEILNNAQNKNNLNNFEQSNINLINNAINQSDLSY